MGGENPSNEIEQSRKDGDKFPLKGVLEAGQPTKAVDARQEAIANAAVEGLPALAIPGAPVSPGKPIEQPMPEIKKEPGGKVIVSGEADIVSQGGETRITRLDSSANIEIKRTADGGMAYARTGSSPHESYKCTITPDGTGGNSIDWQRSDGTERVQYHWSPKKPLQGPGKQVPQAINENRNAIQSAQQAENNFENPDVSVAYAVIPKNTDGDVVADDGKGIQICRQDKYSTDDSGELRSRINTVGFDNQQNKIRIGDGGQIKIENVRFGSQFDFVPESNGYHMKSLGPTNDGIVRQSLENGIKSTSYIDKLTVIERPDGKVDKIKSDYLTATETKWLADGTVDICKTNADGGFSQWTFFADYPKGAFVYTEMKADGERSYRDGSNDPVISKSIQQAAKDKMEHLGKKYDIYISAEGDGHIGWRDGSKSFMRTPTLKELQMLESSLEKYAVNNEEDMYFSFLQNKNPNTDIFSGLYNRGSMLYNPHQTNPDDYFKKAVSSEGVPASLEHVMDHELAHHSARRRDIKAWDSGITSHILAEKYGFKSMEDIARHKQLWVAEGQEMIDGISQKHLYAVGDDHHSVMRFNFAGQMVNKEGKVIKQMDPDDRIDIQEVANIKLPTPYAYSNPLEADAETLMFYRHNEQFRATLLERDIKNKSNYYAIAEEEDKIEIDRFKPADKDSPGGYMRIPSGKIVRRTMDNEKLVSEFMRKHGSK